MELGANRKSLQQLGAALAVLALVVYFQFFRATAPPEAPLRPQPRSPLASSPVATEPEPRQSSATGRASGRFRPRLGRSRHDEATDPMSADAVLRKHLLERVRGIGEPTVDRDIFNFGRPPRPPVSPPTPDETELAQARFEAEMQARDRERPTPPPRKSPPGARPPQWKYYGVASVPDSDSQRAFLLAGEEILVASEGSLLEERYRIGRIGLESISFVDEQADQEFSIPLEVPR